MNCKSLFAITLTVPALGLALAGAARSQCTLAKLQEPSSNADDRFGRAVALDGDTFVVSEAGIDDAGSVHVFVRTGPTWTHVQELLSPDPAPSQQFGAALALQGDWLLVGAPWPEWDGSGSAAYMFARCDQGTPGDPLDDRFVLDTKLVPEPGPSIGYFGWGVALSGDVALVGAPWFWDVFGTVVVFAHSGTWIEQARLDLPGSPTSTEFGTTVALLDARTALVTDARDEVGALGACHVFGRDTQGTEDPLDDTWSLLHTLDAPGAPAAKLGDALASDGDLVACEGAWLVPGSSDTWGESVFVFERDSQSTPEPFDDTWAEPAMIPSPGDPEYCGGFGYRLALSGERLLLKGPECGWFGPTDGGEARTYVRVGGEWELEHEFGAPDEAIIDNFALSVVLQRDTALIGAPGDPDSYEYNLVEGAAYVVDLAAAPAWQPVDVVDVDDGVPDLAGWGAPAAGAPVALRVYNSWDFAPVVLVIGLQRIDAPVLGQVLVPSPDVVLGLSIGPDPDHDIELAGRWPPGLPAGTTLWLQTWTDMYDGWTASTAISVTQP